MDKDEKRKQVIKQCKAVAHLATALAQVHTDKAKMYEFEGTPAGIIEMNGKNTAAYMEQLGNILNGMDAVDDEDAWLDPIFRKAQQLWPTAD